MKEKSRHILEERNMRWYYFGQLLSLTGLMARSAILSLLIMQMVGKEQGSFYVGLARSTEFVVGAFLGVFVGIMLDSFDKRNVLQITASFMILQAAAFALISCSGPVHASMWAIMLVSVSGGFTSAIDGTARNAIIRDALINQEHARFGSSLFTSLYTFAMLAGNGLAGYLVHYVGYSNSFILNGISFLVLIFSLRRMDFSHHVIQPNSKKILHRVSDGAKFTFGDAGIRLCILFSLLITIFGFVYNVLLPVMNRVMFNGDEKQYSYLATWSGIGALVGAILALAYGGKRTMAFVVLGCIASGIGYITVAYTTNPNHAVIPLFLCGFGFMVSFTPTRGALTHLVPKTRSGVVFGIVFMFFYGAMMLSSFISGWLARHFGCPAVLIGSGVSICLVGLVAPFIPGMKRL